MTHTESMSFLKELNGVFIWFFVFGRFPFIFDPHSNQIIATKSTVAYTIISQIVYFILSVNFFYTLLTGFGINQYESMLKKSSICINNVFLWTTYAAVSTLIISNRQEKMMILNHLNSWHITSKLKKQFYILLIVLSVYYVTASMAFLLNKYPAITVIYSLIAESARTLIILFVIDILLISKLIGVQIAKHNSALQVLCSKKKCVPLNFTNVLLSFDDISNIKTAFSGTISVQLLLILTNELVYMAGMMYGIFIHFIQNKPMRRLFLAIHIFPHSFFLALIFHTMDTFGGQVCVYIARISLILAFSII